MEMVSARSHKPRLQVRVLLPQQKRWNEPVAVGASDKVVILDFVYGCGNGLLRNTKTVEPSLQAVFYKKNKI